MMLPTFGKDCIVIAIVEPAQLWLCRGDLLWQHAQITNKEPLTRPAV
jgi:hypothetical protein